MSEEGAWSLYWAVTDGHACLPGIPTTLAARIEAVWATLAKRLPPAARLLDIATGNGAVLRALAARRNDLSLCGIDSAQVRVDARFTLLGRVAAEALPFDDREFAAVTSQFGLEYCGRAAWHETGRVLQPAGVLRLVCHHEDSAALAHNRARLAAMQAMDAAGMFALARSMAAGALEDAAWGGRVLAARRAHDKQSIVMELPAAIGAALARPDGLAVIASIERQARGEMARLAAMDAAALDSAAVAERVLWLADAGISSEATLISTDTGVPFAWDINGLKR